jgi:hypothetical protein
MSAGDQPLPPVSFDYGKANDVIAKLDDLIRKVNSQKQDRMTNGQSMRQNWKGKYAVDFDGELKRMWNEGGDNVTRMAALKTRISDAIAAAQAEQRRRDQYNQQLQEQQPDPGAIPLGPGEI